jgi:hypothetical protein
MKRLEQCKDNNMSKTYRLLCVWGGYVDLSGCGRIFEDALMNQGVPYMWTYISYRTYTGYNCLPEVEPLGSKDVHAEDFVKN